MKGQRYQSVIGFGLLATSLNADNLKGLFGDPLSRKGNEMMRKVFMFVLALTLAVFATSAIAQTSTTGSIEGTVTDQNGAAVPGVTVTVTSPNLITPQSATSDDNGHYRVLNLPPGTYKVTVEATKGFGKYEKADVLVNLDKT